MERIQELDLTDEQEAKIAEIQKAGRPKVLSFEDKKQIAGLIQVGCSRRYAARYVGCSPQTVRWWHSQRD